ncbi:MAG: polysaccharide biosynthesis/export family protein [Chitinispirillaceae bacterium]
MKNRTMGKGMAGAVLGLSALLFLGCAPVLEGNGELVVKSDYTEKQDPFVPGDGLRITVFPDTAHFLNGVYPIDLEGYISLPLLGRFQVSAMSTRQFTEFIKNSYAQYMRFPEVQVTPLIRVSMLGGFARPGLYYIEPQRSLWDLVYIAGGPSHEEGLHKMRLERDKRIISGDLIPYYQTGQSLSSLGVKSGDQIWTPNDPERTVWDLVVGDILPVATFIMSLYVTMIRN